MTKKKGIEVLRTLPTIPSEDVEEVIQRIRGAVPPDLIPANFPNIEEVTHTGDELRNRAVNGLKGVLGNLFPYFEWDDSAERTAERFVDYLMEYQPIAELPFKFTTFPAKVNQLIVIKDIEFSSICMHHLLPFFGVAHVGYIPNELLVGASKIPRLVDFWARRPSTQEYLTANVASDLKHRLSAMGVAVVVEAQHTCMSCRGVRKVGSKMVTSEMRGVFLTSDSARSEALRAMGVD